MKNVFSWTCRASLVLSFVLLNVSCGNSKSGDEVPAAPLGEMNAALQSASRNYGIPLRYMQATAYVESGLNASPASAKLVGNNNGSRLSTSESAFGLSFAMLKLDDKPDNYNLTAQAPAYAAYVKDEITKTGLNLSVNPANLTDKYDWVVNLSRIHRPGAEVNRDLQILFARELTRVLNQGFRYEDATTGEIVELKPETEMIDITRLPDHLQETLSLYATDSDIMSAVSLRIFPEDSHTRDNLPQRVQVIHCPFSFSTCLQQMQQNVPGRPKLEAHYVIPTDFTTINKPVQVARHSESVSVVDASGQAQTLRDAIVIMLTGQSGFYQNGTRITANPIWFTKEQLIQLSWVVRDLCPTLKRNNSSLDAQRCMQATPKGAVTFQTADLTYAGYRWGDIPDFNEDIFWAYLQAQSKLPGDTQFSWRDPSKTFNAGSAIDLTVQFYPGIAEVTVQQAKRCDDNRLIWSTIWSQQVQNIAQKSFPITLYAPGPNKTGQQFVRALLYSSKGTLEAWTQDTFSIRNFNQEMKATADLSSCQH